MKSIEKFYDLPAGMYCGVLLREKTAKKLTKLLYKQSQDIKELLASDLNQLEVSDWTLAYPDGKQTSVKYYIPSTDDDKLKRLKLFDTSDKIQFCKDGVFVVNSRDEAESVYMEWYEKTNI